MNWQDVVISVGSFVLTLSLIPTVLAKEKPALSTSLITGTWLAIFVVTFATIPLWFTAMVNVITSSMWFILSIQVIRRKKHTSLSS